MKIILILAIISLSGFSCQSQTTGYKDSNVCIASEVYKGKVNHGKSYCVAWSTVREYKDGRKDTISWGSGGKTFIGNEYEKYQKLSKRGQYIVDSLKEDGITQLQQSYLTYEPIYMKPGKKEKWLWEIWGDRVKMYKYLFWNNNNGNGFKLLTEIVVE